jgi:hypothetical protein
VDFSSYRNHLLEQPVGEVALFALVRNFSQWLFVANRRLAHFLNRMVNIAIAIVLFLVIWWGASLIVTEISHAQI